MGEDQCRHDVKEEDNDDGTFIRHRYAWCSEGFKQFVEKLEEQIARNKKLSQEANV